MASKIVYTGQLIGFDSTKSTNWENFNGALVERTQLNIVLGGGSITQEGCLSLSKSPLKVKMTIETVEDE